MNETNITSALLATDISLGEAFTILKPLAIFIFGIAVYAIFVFHFYRYIARRSILTFSLDAYTMRMSSAPKKFIAFIGYLLRYIIVFPLLTFFWIAILTVLLTFLAKNQGIENILLVSISVVAAIRITAYYNEDLSKDVAKMLPFALLAVFLVDITYFSVGDSIDALLKIPTLLLQLKYYFIFVIFLEFGLRILHGIFQKDTAIFSD